METTEQKNEAKNQDFKTEVVCDVKRSETEVYRIARKEYQGKHFVDIRIFFRSKEDNDRLIPTRKGLCLDENIRQELITGLISARKAAAVERKEGEEVRSVAVCDIPFSETEVLRISKGSGSKNAFVDIRRFYQKDNGYFPQRKGISIQESCLDEVITGLMQAEPAHSA